MTAALTADRRVENVATGPCGRLIQDERALRVLVFSMHADALDAARATEAGATGYLSKTIAPDDSTRPQTEVRRRRPRPGSAAGVEGR
jgi:CheY-like chemotaxis protein